MRASFIFSGLLTFALGSPAPQSPAATSKATDFLATFDTLAGSAILPELKFIPDGYKGLSWPSQRVFTDTITSLPPRSGQNVDAIFVGDAVVDVSSFNIQTTGSTKSFKLKNLYQGCVAPTNTGLVALSCTITYTGTKVAGKGGPVVKKCTYDAGSLLPPYKPLTVCTFPETFTDLQKVNIAFDPPVTTLTKVLLVDDVSGTTFV